MVDRCRGDRGSLSVPALILIVALVVSFGLVADGGRALAERREVRGAAAAAARSGANMTNAEVVAGALNPGLAAQRARDSLGLDGVTGSVSIAGNVVTVSATAHVDYILLPGGGDVHGQASAAPFRGITSGSAG